MRQNQPDACFSTAQPVVGLVPQPDDESDVTRVGAVPRVYLYSRLSNL